MPKEYRVVISNRALIELTEIAAFIYQQSPQNSAAVCDTILNAIDTLDFMPSRFRQVEMSRKSGRGVHVMVVKPSLFITESMSELREWMF